MRRMGGIVIHGSGPIFGPVSIRNTVFQILLKTIDVDTLLMKWFDFLS
jgi:hypothetical protein